MLRSMLHSGLPFTHVTMVIHFDSSANSDLKLWEMTRRSQTRADGLLLMAAFQPLLGPCLSRSIQSDEGSFVFLT